ncbi:52 kDa repressor of the inhibitor of the protein kinase-like [Antedon mediterranea]|uniref:52 kDa repressor of the inhibitor of the protein kinase-like n=1 Tax=Antedon mediterranea TaxID=105859 RepID=UPI003AF8D22E
MPRKERGRKRKQQDLAEQAKHCVKLGGWLLHTSNKDDQLDTSGPPIFLPAAAEVCNNDQQGLDTSSSGPPTFLPAAADEVCLFPGVDEDGNLSDPETAVNDDIDVDIQLPVDLEMPIEQEGVICKDVGDIVNKLIDISTLTPSEKLKYIDNHFVPDSNYKHFLKQIVMQGEGRSKTLTFQYSWLDQYKWLVYSPSDHGGYCKYCVMFPPDKTNLSNAVLVGRPFKILKHAKGKDGVLDCHTNFLYHKTAVDKYKQLSMSFLHPEHHVDVLLNDASKQIYKDNIHILQSIIEAVLLCGKQNIALRGHRDDSTSSCSNTGNFLAILKLLSGRDPILRKHLESSNKNSTYTSKTIQNELIGIIGEFVRNKITIDLSDQKYSKYYTIIADEVTDTTTNKEVLSICLRFLTGDEQVEIAEHFVDFVNLNRTTGKAIADAIMKSLSDNGFNYQNLRGQAYDGASAMSSAVRGVNGRIREVVPLALYSHCKSHILNLSIASSCKLQEIRNMIGSINEVFLFFSNSPKRQAMFESVLEHSDYDGKKKKIKGLCKTRWVERHDCYETFHELFAHIVTTLEVILRPNDFPDIIGNEDWSWDPDTRTKAQGLYSTLQSFEFLMSFFVTKQCLFPNRPIAVKLQRSNLDSFEAYHKIDTVISQLQEIRRDIDNHFSAWFADASQLTISVGGVVSKPRTNRRQLHRSNVPADTIEEYFRKNLAIPFIDHLLNEMETRFNAQSRVIASLFEIIPELIIKSVNVAPVCEKLLFWKSDLPSPLSLCNELRYWRAHWVTVKREEHPQNLLECLRNCDKDIYPNIYELLCIGCVSPVGSAEAERSFSGLRRVKSYLRNRMTVERLTGLSLMMIHHDVDVDVNVISDIFIRRNNRRLFKRSILNML